MLNLRRDRRAKISRFAASLAVGWLGILLPGASAAESSLETLDQPYASILVNQALETERTNVAIPWSNPETGNKGTITIERTFYRDPNTPCRSYRRTLERPGQPMVTLLGQGCRVGPAVWKTEERPETTAPPSSAPPSAPSPPVAPAPPPASPPPPDAPAPRSPAPRSEVKPAKPKADRAAERPTAEPLSPSAEPPALPPYTSPSKAPL